MKKWGKYFGRWSAAGFAGYRIGRRTYPLPLKLYKIISTLSGP